MDYRQNISSLLIFFFLVEIMSPLAFAQPITTPAPTTYAGPSLGICEVNEFTPEQTRLFWDNTRDFQAQEINSLALAALMANKPSQQITNVYNNVNNNEKVYPFEFLARRLGLDEKKAKEAANSIGKAVTDRITEKEATELIQKQGKASELEIILGSMRGSPNADTPSYEGYKHKFINGAEIPVTALKNAIEQTNACMINSAHIQGRVSYAASLSDDVAISFDRATSKKNATNNIWSKEANIDLDLQGASTLVVPKQYEELVKKLKFWLMTDVLATALQGAYFFAGKKFMERRINEIKEIDERIIRHGQDTFTTQTLAQDPIKREVYSLGSRSEISKLDFENSLTVMEQGLIGRYTPDPAQLPPGQTVDQYLAQLYQTDRGYASKIDAITNARADVANLAQDARVEEIYQRHQNQLTSAAGFLPNEVDEIEKSQVRLRMQRKRTKLLNELENQEFETDLKKVKNRLARRTGELWFRIFLGAAWLGPGRGVFELTDAINFEQISGRAYGNNYITIMANNKDVLGEFRRATNWVLTGTITDTLSDWTDEGIPTAAYWVGNLLLVNQPVEQERNDPTNQVTSFTTSAGKWNVQTKWNGKSDAYVAEDLTVGSEYARLPMQVKGKRWSLKIRARDEFKAFYSTMQWLVPILSWRLLGATDYALTGARLLVYDFYVTDVINPANFKTDERCDPEKIDGYISWFRGLTIANQATGWIGVAGPWLKGVKATTATATKVFSKFGWVNTNVISKYGSALIQAFDPITLAQGYVAGEALEYASYCKDDEYTIVAYQSLKRKIGAGLSEKLKSVGSSDILKNLNIGKAAFGVGQEIDLAALNEYANLKSELNDQISHVRADGLYYMSFKDASIQWIPSLDPNQPASCQRKCLDSDKKAVCVSEEGVEAIDKKTGNAVKLANRDRAMAQKEDDRFAATIIPNKYISTTLAGCPGGVFEVDSSRNLMLTAGQACAGAQCIKIQLQALTGRVIGSDLTPALGRVTKVYTTQGGADIADGIIRFNALTTVNDQVELRSPGLEVLETASSSDESALKASAAITVNGNGQTYLQGAINSANNEEVNIGELKTIITERGRINYLGNGQVQVFVHTLAEVNSGLIKDLGVLPVQKDQCDEKTPGIKIDRVIGHPGVGDEAAQELNEALQKIQGCNGFQILETADKKFEITTDSQGNPILRVTDKKTGEVIDYKINGPLRREGNDIVIPTDQGDFRFNIGMGENGQPMLGVTGPNGLEELLPLLAARGFGGVLLFDPRTGQWSAFNGQDLAMNPNFATRGQTITADSNGNVRGIPAEDLLFPSRRKDTAGNSLASLPSWPSETPAIALLVIITLAGIAIVRFKKS